MKIIEKALETVKKVDLENILKEYFSSDFEIDDNDGPDVWVEDNWLSVNFEKKQVTKPSKPSKQNFQKSTKKKENPILPLAIESLKAPQSKNSGFIPR